MASLQELLVFCETDEELSNRELVELIVYYQTVVQKNDYCASAEIRNIFNSINHPVPGRIAQYLNEGTSKQRRQYVKRGKGYALHRINLAKLNEKLSSYTGVVKPVSNESILTASSCTGGRRYLVSLVEQINGSYTYGFYDGAAVLMRRMMESLIISSFEKKGKEAQIRDADGNYLMLKDLISQAKNPSNFRLSRGMGDVMDSIKDLGDTAAHNRTYITKKTDVDNVQSKFRRLIEELCVLAGISES
ncbi:hypothetical protein [Roseibium sp.]|uniref:hypothetical protein n=1 Tax=Roseibium sp. TaxID=1936156 RepID=UPI0029C97FE0|nr:hypothetical protein [uncultured Roseibium sp.]